MYYDPTGRFPALHEFSLPAKIAVAVVAALASGVFQFVSNALAGARGWELLRGVAGAMINGGINAFMLCSMQSFVFAAFVGAFFQTGADVVEAWIRGEPLRLVEIIANGLVNFATTLFGNILGGELIKTNPGWFGTQKITSVFTGRYGQKVLLQSLIGAVLSGIVNWISKFAGNFNKKKTVEKTTLISNQIKRSMNE